jgi:hypothetical protein
MRRLIVLMVILLVGVLALEGWKPGNNAFAPTPTSTATLLPENFTLIPTFVPSFPCELQNVEVHDEQLCRYEQVTERKLTSGDGVVFIDHQYYMGQGCWDSVSQQSRELRVCSQGSGASTTPSKDFVTDLIASPDGEWLAFGTMNRLSTGIESVRPHLYRVRSDGSELQPLDTQGFDGYRVGAARDLRWENNDWLAFSLWDGSDGYYAYRLKADGSGTYEEGIRITNTPAPTFPPQPSAVPPSAGAPLIGTPLPPQPTATPPAN